MAEQQNAFGQTIGPSLEGWTPRQLPPTTSLTGRYCRVEKLDPKRHAAALYSAYAEAPDWRDWTYLPLGPFPSEAEFIAFAHDASLSADPLHYTVLDSSTHEPLGTAALMRIDPDNGVIEVGFVNYSPRLQRTRAGTDAMFLLMRRAFDELGYRRYEWKCDRLNRPSRRAAERYGFTYEGTFRQSVVYKGRSRDTAWYSITDREWATLIRPSFERWLSPTNFDSKGRQLTSLSNIRAEVEKGSNNPTVS